MIRRYFLYGVKKGVISKNSKTKLETKFAESEKKMNSLENKLQLIKATNKEYELKTYEDTSGYEKARLLNAKMIKEKLSLHLYDLVKKATKRLFNQISKFEEFYRI